MTQKKLTGKGEQMKEKMVAIPARILREKGFRKTPLPFLMIPGFR